MLLCYCKLLFVIIIFIVVVIIIIIAVKALNAYAVGALALIIYNTPSVGGEDAGIFLQAGPVNVPIPSYNIKASIATILINAINAVNGANINNSALIVK